jgi:TetR/AcrR family transcriptional regulator, transcriptional repressor for nem operon
MDEVIHSVGKIRAMSTTSPSPRPLTRKGQETRQRIVDAAAGLIFQQGVAHTTIEDVRAAADVSSSQLYHYFDDKPALVRAVVDHQAETMVGGQESFDFSTLDGLRAWRDFVIAGQREHRCSGGCPIGSLGGQLAETDPDARSHVAEGFKRWEATIQNGLREMRARGELPPDTDPDTLGLALLAALQGGLLLTQVKRDTKPLEAALDAMIELVARLSGGNR